MLRKCYGCIGRRHTSAGEVLQQARYLARRGCAQAQARAGAHALSQVYVRAGELEAGSCELDTRVGELQAAS